MHKFLFFASCKDLFFSSPEGLWSTFSASASLIRPPQESFTAYKQPSQTIPASCFGDRNTTLTRLLEHWKEAQNLLNRHAPPETAKRRTVAFNSSDLNLQPKEKSWLEHFASFSGGHSHLKSKNSAYLRIFKGGNDALRKNMDLLGMSITFDTPGFNGTDYKCIFTFVRDPIQHFLSGYSEFEFRTITAKLTACFMCTYHNWPLGSQHRFWAFLYDVLSLNLIDSHESIRHIFPMSGILHHYPRVDFVGSVENMAEDWKRLQRDCFHTGEADLVEFDDHMGLHESSSDPFGVYQAAKDVVRGSPIVEQVLRKVLYEDYRCFYNGGDE